MIDRMLFLLRELNERPGAAQRSIAASMHVSVGTVNALIREALDRSLIRRETVDRRYVLTEAGFKLLSPCRMDGAVILAAGFGSRFVPFTYETPKGLLEVYGERMLERQIRQLQDAGIRDITLVVGYLKEKFEYLTDKFGVRLLFNPDYAVRNNISSVYYAAPLLEGRNMYLLSSDNWLRNNLFHLYEPGSWYSAVHMKGRTGEWALTVNSRGTITDVRIGGEDCNVMYGPVCLMKEFTAAFLPALREAYQMPGKEQYYWENVYVDLLHSVSGAPDLAMNLRPDGEVYEFENLEELRAFDPSYRDHSGNEALALISKVFRVPESEIRGIRILKAGMTNHSFLFETCGKSCICRIPGEGTDKLIDRKQEGCVYEAVRDLGLSEEVLYFDPATGYKISSYYENSRTADLSSDADRKACMALLRKLHASGIRVPHSFDLRERIGFYEGLCLGSGGIPFEDYASVYALMDRLLSWIDSLKRPSVLAHIDSVATNFLFTERDGLRLIDWEYAGMADPLTDIAMCAIYSYFTREEADGLLAEYLGRAPEEEETLLVYAYMALGGFLWALWAVYKENLGTPFGEYTLIMYRYAKEFGRLTAARKVF